MPEPEVIIDKLQVTRRIMLFLATRRQLRKKKKKLSAPKRKRLREITTLGSPSRNRLPKRIG